MKKIKDFFKAHLTATVAVLSLVISVATFWYTVLLPLRSRANIEYLPIKNVTIGIAFNLVSYGKLLEVINTGDKPAIVSRIKTFIINENSQATQFFDEVSAAVNWNGSTMFETVNGFSVYALGGYRKNVSYGKHAEQDLLNQVKSIREQVKREKDSINRSYRPTDVKLWIPEPDKDTIKYNISPTTKELINGIQQKILESVMPGTYLFCEKINTSEGQTFMQVYRFKIAESHYQQFKQQIQLKHLQLFDLDAYTTISLDLKPVSKEVFDNCREIVARYEKEHKEVY